jgi:hypothetical protein
MGGLLLENNIDPGWYVVKINSNSDYILNGTDMYVINRFEPEICNNLRPGKYCGKFRVNGKDVANYYEKPSDVPKYLVIDIRDGNEKFYTELKVMPLSDRGFFEKIPSNP